MPWVDPRDIATVATLRLLAGDWTGRQVQAVPGPADLTWTEAAAALSTATGVPVKAHRSPTTNSAPPCAARAWEK
jgi:NAD(P)H dehydrogenase (quinone)